MLLLCTTNFVDNPTNTTSWLNELELEQPHVCPVLVFKFEHKTDCMEFSIMIFNLIFCIN